MMVRNMSVVDELWFVIGIFVGFEIFVIVKVLFLLSFES